MKSADNSTFWQIIQMFERNRNSDEKYIQDLKLKQKQ